MSVCQRAWCTMIPAAPNELSSLLPGRTQAGLKTSWTLKEKEHVKRDKTDLQESRLGGLAGCRVDVVAIVVAHIACIAPDKSKSPLSFYPRAQCYWHPPQ